MLTHRWRPAMVSIVLLIAGLIALVPAVPASAALSASLGTLTLPSVVTSHSVQSTTGRTVLTATDTSHGQGWHVTLQASDMVYNGPNRGKNIPAGNLAIASAEAPTAVSGHPVDPVHGPMAPTPSPSGPLNSARKVLHANPGHGTGTYTQGIILSLTIPGGTRAGTYTSKITTTIGSGP